MTDFKGVQLFSGKTTSLAAGATGNQSFTPNFGGNGTHPGDKPLLQIYGTYGTASCVLKYKAPDGNFYPVNGVSISGVGLYELPVNSNVVLSLDYTAGGGSDISAFVIHGKEAV